MKWQIGHSIYYKWSMFKTILMDMHMEQPVKSTACVQVAMADGLCKDTHTFMCTYTHTHAETSLLCIY